MKIKTILSEIEVGKCMFGCDIALSSDGKYLAIGDPVFSNTSGKVYVYKLNSEGDWVLFQTINGQTLNFGNRVSISADGSKLIINDDVDLSFRDSQGFPKIYTYMLVNGRYKLINISDFGVELYNSSISGDGLVMASWESNIQTCLSEREYNKLNIYHWNDKKRCWIVKDSIIPDNSGEYIVLGYENNLNYHGNTLLASSINMQTNQKEVVIYEWNPDNFKYHKVNTITPPDEIKNTDSIFGYSVSLTKSGKSMVITSHNILGVNTGTGVFKYNNVDGDIALVANYMYPDDYVTNFGISASVNGDGSTVAVVYSGKHRRRAVDVITL